MAFDPRTKEERKLFPFWTLIVIAGCAALWVFGAKIYQESMAAYRSYAAITQNAAQNTYYPGVFVDGIDLGRHDPRGSDRPVRRQAAADQRRVFTGCAIRRTEVAALRPAKCR